MNIDSQILYEREQHVSSADASDVTLKVDMRPSIDTSVFNLQNRLKKIENLSVSTEVMLT